jgi:hypothetical protein
MDWAMEDWAIDPATSFGFDGPNGQGWHKEVLIVVCNIVDNIHQASNRCSRRPKYNLKTWGRLGKSLAMRNELILNFDRH